MGVHPVEHGGTAGDHDVSFYCDDIVGTVADIKARGVTFAADVADHGYELVTYLTAPGGIRIQLYEPRYKKLGPAKKAKGRAALAHAKTKAAAKRKAAPKKAKPRAKAQRAGTKEARPAARKKKSATRRYSASLRIEARYCSSRKSEASSFTQRRPRWRVTRQ